MCFITTSTKNNLERSVLKISNHYYFGGYWEIYLADVVPIGIGYLRKYSCFSLKDVICIFLERGEGRGEEGERNSLYFKLFKEKH